jgi:bacterioferritin (cytochrome b1)
MSFGKRQSVAASSQPMQKCLKMDLEMERKIIKKYRSGLSLSAIASARLFIFVQFEKHG